MNEENEIDWTQNCLTAGIHNGREGAIWSMPLGYAVSIFEADTLRELVIERIYSDAMQYVKNYSSIQEETGASMRFVPEWADEVKHYAELMYQDTLDKKIEELKKYYKEHRFQRDLIQAVERVKEDKLNVFYEPLHTHDTINLLCRIIGVSASRQAS